ncbi:MAG: glycosyltransferase family 4 protein [Solirubrobacteraceae bacterium]|jgi:glycosyltransferase involved in cell wall biosynthesis
MSGRRLARFRARVAGVVAGAQPAPWASSAHAALLELERDGAAPLAGQRPAAGGPLSIAIVIPSFRRGSGGHATIAHLVRGLQARGNDVSLWLEDYQRRHIEESEAETARRFEEFFTPGDVRLHKDWTAWSGADVVVATDWVTVSRVLLLGGAGARAYLVQDHEADFYGASAEALWAAQTYRRGLHCIAASRWLADLLADRYGASATHFDLGVDHDTYRPPTGRRRDDLVVFYARAVTARRAVPLGLLALSELARRRPTLDIALYGDATAPGAPFAHRQLGVLDSASLAELYCEATVGMALSLTNSSLICLEMMAAGLPCVELASESMRATFGDDGPLELAAPDPLALCAALERLLDAPEVRLGMSRGGIELMRERTWERAARQVEDGLRVLCRSR